MHVVDIGSRGCVGAHRTHGGANAYLFNGVAAAGSDRPAIQTLDTVCHYGLLALPDVSIGTGASNFRRFSIVITGPRPRYPNAPPPRPRVGRTRFVPVCDRRRGHRPGRCLACVPRAFRTGPAILPADRDGSDWRAPAIPGSTARQPLPGGSGAGPTARSHR